MAFGHGKVILLGEHSVVHGRPALAVAVARGAEVIATPAAAEQSATTLHIMPWDVTVDSGPAPNEGREPLQEALRVACGFYDDGRQFALSAGMRLPSGAGMGSSAALGVAVLRALDDARGLSRPDEEIYERSLAWEGVFHGNPSGVDNAMATHGGVALFRRGSPLTPVVPRHPVRLVAAYSGVSASTKGMVESVARQFERDPARVGQQFDAIGAIVMNGKLALEQGDLRSLGQLMTMNHKLLAGLMLSTAPLEEMITAAMDAGALGAKVTGAGGGGCMIALVDGAAQQQAVGDALRQLGKPVYDVESGS
jgi:mevalonate kinase